MMNSQRSFLGWGMSLGAVMAFLIVSDSLPAATVTLTSAADTALFENAPDNNLGGVSFMPIGTTAIGTRNRGLVRFDLDGNVPAGATIQSAILRLRVTQGSGFSRRDYSAHRVLREWGEGTKSNGPNGAGNIGALATTGEASWRHRLAPATAWGMAGGEAGIDYTAMASATVNVGAVGNYDFTSAALAADVQDWMANPADNFGWMIIINDESIFGSARRFASREASSNRPSLIVEYSLPLSIESVERDGDRLRLTFQARAGQSYFVQRRPDVASGNWTTLTNLPVQTASGPITVFDGLDSGSQFYRLGAE